MATTYVYLIIMMLTPSDLSGFNVDMTSYAAIPAVNVRQCVKARDAWQHDMKENESAGIAMCASYGFPLDLTKPIGVDTILAGRVLLSEQ